MVQRYDLLLNIPTKMVQIYDLSIIPTKYLLFYQQEILCYILNKNARTLLYILKKEYDRITTCLATKNPSIINAPYIYRLIYCRSKGTLNDIIEQSKVVSHTPYYIYNIKLIKG